MFAVIGIWMHVHFFTVENIPRHKPKRFERSSITNIWLQYQRKFSNWFVREIRREWLKSIRFFVNIKSFGLHPKPGSFLQQNVSDLPISSWYRVITMLQSYHQPTMSNSIYADSTSMWDAFHTPLSVPQCQVHCQISFARKRTIWKMSPTTNVLWIHWMYP